ncbi:MAG: hypothetical protein ACEPOV_06410 [Hyphomicrobiales bacterium]
MKEVLLKIKNWQLFIIFCVIPVLIDKIPISLLDLNTVKIWRFHSVIPFNSLFSFFFYLFILMIIVILWFHSISIGLQRKLPKGIKMNVKRFKICFVLSFFVIPINMILGYFVVLHGIYVQAVPSSSENLTHMGFFLIIFLLSIPVYIVSIFILFYQVYFAAKISKITELQREVHFYEYTNEFLLFWFFPVGVWFLQPKINKFMKTHK